MGFRIYILIFCLIALFSCAAFQGNTRKKFGDFDIEDRQQYQHYLNERAEKPLLQDREALKRLKTNATTETKKAPREKTIRSDEEPPRSLPVRLIRRLFRVKDEN